MIQLFSDSAIAKKMAEIRAEIARLQAPVTLAEAEEAFDDPYANISDCVPEGTTIGEFRKVLGKDFGFVNDVFIKPKLAANLRDGDSVAVRVEQGTRGEFATHVADAHEYLSWHRDEILGAIVRKLSAERKERADRIERWQNPQEEWTKMKEKAATVGFTLIEVCFRTDSTAYGGRGEDSYIVEGNVTMERVQRLLDVLHRRHEERGNSAPYDHGHDNITLNPKGFTNSWCGPWTD